MKNRDKPWKQGQNLTAKDVSLIIQSNFPKLNLRDIKILGSGWDNTTWLINHEWVFRLPKHHEAATLIQNEINLLPNLTDLAVKTPNPEYIALNPKHYPFPIYGHRFIEGQSADKANLTDNERIKLAEPIATFLKRLHSFPISKAQRLNIDYDRIGRLNIKDRIEKFRFQINYLAKHKLIQSPALLIDYYQAYRDLDVPDVKVLGHGDFYARHILLDENKQFHAVIDWGDSELFHPAVDLAIGYQFFPIEAHKLFWQIYGKANQTTQTLAKLRAIYGASGMGWYAHCVGDKSLLKESIESLDRLTKVIT
jgi:aminoglycoside phosphotransferase (APT) family kinase protein